MIDLITSEAVAALVQVVMIDLVLAGDDPGQYLRAREGECELGTLAIGKRCQERISATGWAW